MGEICPDGRTVVVTLELQPEQPAAKARATDENTIQDVNLYLYGNGQSYHFYATGASHQIDIAPGTYSIHAAVNQHKDLGELPYSALINYRTDAPQEGTLTMYGYAYQKLDLTTKVIQVSVKRNAAKIAYNITVAPDKEIEILSVQLCSMPNKDYLICEEQMDLTDPSYGFYDSEVRTLPEGAKSASGLFYMLSNRRGENSTIKDQKQKNAENAPENASFFRIRGRSGENKIVDYIVYLGANNTSDFNVWPNEAHTYNITLSGDNETDTRISSYTLDITDWWPRKYNVPDNDYGGLDIYVTNKSDYTFTGTLKVMKGDGEKFAAGDGGWNFGPDVELYIPQRGGQRYDLRYAPSLVKKGVNSQVQYQVVVNDNAGESTKFNFACEFANMVQAYFTTGTGSVTVSGELAKAAGTNYVLAYCYEDGCTFTAVDGNGYAFDGWYADQAYTQLLSASASYMYAPTKAKSSIYAKFALEKQPKVEISCNQQNKNSTYMYNKNTVTMTVTDYSGPVTIKATCAAGGLFTSTTSFSKTVVSGQSFTLDPIVFVPTAVGNISYTLDVTTSTGIKIGSKTVTNNIVATKLTPKISISYDSNTRQTSYKPAYTSTYVYWFGYKTVIARVAFTPALDYPAPIESAQLLKIQLYPTFRAYEITGAEDTSSGQWAPVERTINSPSISGHEFAPINTTYADAQGISYTLTSVSNMTGLDAKNPLLAPYTEGDTILLLPFTESEAIAAKMMDRTFIKYFFNKPTLLPSQISVSNSYPKNDLQIVTDIKLINITNNL
ncbi:DUF4906 domain-containing protein [Hominenteromicrobium sp.]|uniref:DUF4906 domain-containing protein n=1 Tax=Hominenteromicrobium sp. TaxID=3073581 RepID=UPI003AB4149E